LYGNREVDADKRFVPQPCLGGPSRTSSGFQNPLASRPQQWLILLSFFVSKKNRLLQLPLPAELNRLNYVCNPLFDGYRPCHNRGECCANGFSKFRTPRLHCWSFIRRRVAAVVSSNKCTRTAGNLLRYDWINSGRKPDTDALTQPMASDPVSPRAARRAICLESSAWARISFASDKKALPAAVSSRCAWCGAAAKTPSSSSKDLICWLMAGCATCNSSAARVKFCRGDGHEVFKIAQFHAGKSNRANLSLREASAISTITEHWLISSRRPKNGAANGTKN